MVEYYLEEKLFVTQKTESVKLNKNHFAEFYPKFLRMVETHFAILSMAQYLHALIFVVVDFLQ